MPKRDEIRKSNAQLAAAVAHEFRNPLTTIKGLLYLINSGTDHQEYHHIIREEINKLERLTEEFLMLAETRAVDLAESPLNLIVQQAVRAVEKDARLSRCQINLKLSESLPKVLCDRVKLERAFINILESSIKAMPNGGTVEIRGLVSKRCVMVQIIDHRVGLTKEEINQVGYPQYSISKDPTGLGLMVSFNIIEQHNGHISVQSHLPKGTLVNIRLPICEN